MQGDTNGCNLKQTRKHAGGGGRGGGGGGALAARQWPGIPLSHWRHLFSQAELEKLEIPNTPENVDGEKPSVNCEN